MAKEAGAAGSESVEAFLATLDHPFEREIVALREIILGADPCIAEGIEWNTPSFRASEWFATFHQRAKGGVRIILHLGAKKRDDAAVSIADPASLLEWLAVDRASAKFRDLADIEAKRAVFGAVIREWVQHV